MVALVARGETLVVMALINVPDQMVVMVVMAVMVVTVEMAATVEMEPQSVFR
jgi:hypothetical protein